MALGLEELLPPAEVLACTLRVSALTVAIAERVAVADADAVAAPVRERAALALSESDRVGPAVSAPLALCKVVADRDELADADCEGPDDIEWLRLTLALADADAECDAEGEVRALAEAAPALALGMAL